MSQHLQAMAADAPLDVPAAVPAPVADEPVKVPEAIEEKPKSAPPSSTLANDISDKGHVVVIPRPPEWAQNTKETDEGWSSDDSFTYDSGDESDEEDREVIDTPTSSPAERGIMLSFPHMELYGVELLELTSLSITVKCERCKELLDVERLRNNTKGDHSGMKDESCKKCAMNLAIGVSSQSSRCQDPY